MSAWTSSGAPSGMDTGARPTGKPARTALPLVELGVSALLLVPGILAFGPAFGGLPGYLPATGGALLGLLIVFLSRWRGWSVASVILAGLAAYLIFGGALALSRTTIAGVLPSPETVRRLAVLIVSAWRDLLTVSLPASEFTGPAVVPLISSLVCAILVGRLATGRRLSWTALVPAGVLLIIGILWGTYQAPFAMGQGLLLGATGLVWQSLRRRGGRGGAELVDLGAGAVSHRFAVLPMAAVVTAGALAAGLLAGLVTPSSRFVLRDIVEPPLDTKQFASPLTMFRLLERDLHDQVLMTVEGLPQGGRVRLAALDAYDGVVYNVDAASSGFRLIGRAIGQGRDGDATPSTLRIEIGAYQGVWLPGGGELRGLRFDEAEAARHTERVYYNALTGTALSTAGVSVGSRYDVDVVVVARPDGPTLSTAGLAAVSMPDNVRVPEAVAATAADFVGTASGPFKQLQAITQKLRTSGFYSDGSDGRSRAGHTAERINAFLTDKQLIGDDEQYAVSLALMARHLGIPARVVIGFYPDAAKAKQLRVELTGADAHVWVEVAFAGLGWVAFDASPPRDKKPQSEVPKPRRDPKPQVLPPPDPPLERPDSRVDVADDQRTPTPEEGESYLRYVLLALGVMGALAVLLLPFVSILVVKARRRRIRRSRARLVDRVSGGWAELVDAATDLGSPLDPALTRREAAELLDGRYPAAGAVAIADRVDASVFGVGEPTEADVEHVWREVDQALVGLAKSVPRRRRVRARFSTASLRLARQAGARLRTAAASSVRTDPGRLIRQHPRMRGKS